MRSNAKGKPLGVRQVNRNVAIDREQFKSFGLLAVCVFIALTTLIGWIPKASAQCAIRKNLPQYEPAVASRVWNVSHTQEYRLPSAMAGEYNYVLLQATNPSAATDLTLDRRTLLRDLKTAKLQLFNAPLYVTWNCTVNSDSVNKASQALVLDSSRPDGQYLVADIGKHKELWSDPANFPIRCRLQPVFTPYYMLAYTDFVSSKKQFNQQEIETLYSGTKFPWAPCASGYYTDNELLIVGPYKTLEDISIESKRADIKTLTFRSMKASPVYEKQLWKMNSGGIGSQMTVQSVELPCENLAVSRDKDSAFVQHLLRSFSSNIDELGLGANFSRFEGAWVPNPRRSIVLDSSNDKCLSELSKRMFRITDTESSNAWEFLFTDANDSPAINNHYQNVISDREQCFKNAEAQALYVVNSPSGRGNVRHTHTCYSYATNIGLPPAEYTWSYKTMEKSYQVSPRCINHGIFTHQWTAQACGQRALSVKNVYIEDTTAPRIDRSSKLVTWAKGKTPVALQCHWPSETTRFCIRDKILSAMRQIYADNCDSASELVITPRWNEGSWYTCSRKTGGNVLTGCSPADGSAFKLVTLNDGSQDMCFSKSDLTAGNNAALRYVVQVDVSDSCGNISQNEDRILYSLTFFDHMRKDMAQIRSDLCTAIV